MYIEKPNDEFKKPLVEETIKILKRNYGFPNPIEVPAGGSQIYILPIPDEFDYRRDPKKSKFLNDLTKRLRKEYGVKAGIVDMVSQVLIEPGVLSQIIEESKS